jgi:hypothetical protein
MDAVCGDVVDAVVRKVLAATGVGEYVVAPLLTYAIYATGWSEFRVRSAKVAPSIAVGIVRRRVTPERKHKSCRRD